MLKIILLASFYCALVFAFPDRNARIFNGRNAMPGEFPYMASLRYWGTNFHFAGGSLLNHRWVVTVATPLVGRAHNSINIVLGSTILNAGGDVRQSNEIRIHELFDPATKRNDIALVRSGTPIQFTQFVAPIDISTTFIDYGVVGTIMGWGATERSDGAESNTLRVATTTTVPCVDNNHISFSQHHMCAGIVSSITTEGPTTVITMTTDLLPINTPPEENIQVASSEGALCKGDIGGPMIYHDELIGIAVWNSVRCGSVSDGYLRAASYRGWINGIIHF